MKAKHRLDEDGVAAVPANVVAGGGVEGIGIGPRGEPGAYPDKRKKKLRDVVISKTPLKRVVPR